MTGNGAGVVRIVLCLMEPSIMSLAGAGGWWLNSTEVMLSDTGTLQHPDTGTTTIIILHAEMRYTGCSHSVDT